MGQALRLLGASAALGVVSLGITAAAVPASADPGEHNRDNHSRHDPHWADRLLPAAPPADITSDSSATTPSDAASASPSPLPTITLPAQTGYQSAVATPSPTDSPTASPSPSLPPGFAATDVGALSASGTTLAGTGGTWLALGVVGGAAIGAGGMLAVRRR
ncbi:hypothetical protein [Raineyella sp.]|uniref:Uncharacterized protein n=1 Tax=bioreactor metagenome TaxID=1076179 RepID=A0A644YWX4_9ZZZZ|nr:hypothetical protein [Raineyella sp.]MEA5153664.1 hypothetical protein [Raineyella sp.]